MLELKDIEQAKKLFIEWDNNHCWCLPENAFIEHTKKKAQQTLELAEYLIDKTEKTDELSENKIVTMWIITKCYYSMFFLVEYLLSLDNKKLPEGTMDTHKTIYLAFLYYYIIKGSELEQDCKKKITTSRMSNALTLFKDLQDETLELQRIKKSVLHLKLQREARHKFTYRMDRYAELSEAKSSFHKATEFRKLIGEYISTK
ncbi:MAG: hypothetical protein ABIG89_06400 [Candidatus Woesearchaeota archaeon]